MKKDKTKPEKKQPRAIVSDWQPLFSRLRDAVDWALDIAIKLARGYEEEIEAIERVRGYFHAWLDGRRVDIDLNDVLTTLALLFAAIEIDTGINSAAMLAPLRGYPHALHLPGASRAELPTVVIRRFPARHRNGIQLAA
jgi:hypothetical protein